MSTVTDYLEIATSGTGLLHTASGYYVQLRSQTGGGTYTSVAVTDSTGYYTLTGVPPDSYEIWYSKNLAGPWTDSGKTQYVPVSRPYFDVINYGADPTGAADSTTAIQAALNAATNGGRVYLPAGTYSVNATLTVPAGVAVVEGPGTIRVANGANITPIILSIQGNGLTIRNLTVDGNKASQTLNSAHGIASTTSHSRCRILNCHILNTMGIGINAVQLTDLLIDGCTIEGAGSVATGDGTHAGINLFTADHFRVTNNYITGANDGSIFCGGANVIDGQISGNVLTSAHTFGIALGTTAQKITVANNYIDNTGTNTTVACIDIGNCTGVTVTGNVCVGGGGGIANGGPSFQSTIIGNTCLNSAQTGIAIAGDALGSHCRMTISGNTVYKANYDGISLDSLVDSVCSNNVCMDCSQFSGNTWGGIFLGNTIATPTDIVISGNRCGDDQGTKTQAYGLRNTATVASRVLVIGNDFAGNATAGIQNTAGAGQLIIRHNLGVNPVGSFTAPTFPATGVASAAQSYDATVWIKSGTNAITAIAIGGTTVTVGGTNVTIAAAGAIGGPFRVPAGQTVTLTYTAGGTPAWVWYGD